MKFGLLAYRNTNNLGDEIQSLAAERFLPRVDYRIDRDTLSAFRAGDGESVALILNAWFGHHAENWPPSEAIVPLLTSIHLSPYPGTGVGSFSAEDFFLREPAIEFLRRAGPVGARDLHTLEALERHRVPSYLSGCLTLTLQGDPAIARGEAIVLNDVPSLVAGHVRAKTTREIFLTQHAGTVHFAPDERVAEARGLLARYQAAHCVITTRLHCALPCLALGTPVLLLDVGQEPARFDGLSRLVRRCTIEALVSGSFPFDLEHPAPNPDDHQPLRANLEATVRRFLDGVEGRARPELPETVAEMRFQTMVHLCAERKDRLAAVLKTVALRTDERDALWRTIVDQRAELARRSDEKHRIQAALDAVVTSTEWQAASLAKRTAGRFPSLTAPVRALVGKIFGK